MRTGANARVLVICFALICYLAPALATAQEVDIDRYIIEKAHKDKPAPHAPATAREAVAPPAETPPAVWIVLAVICGIAVVAIIAWIKSPSLIATPRVDSDIEREFIEFMEKEGGTDNDSEAADLSEGDEEEEPPRRIIGEE